MIKIEENISDEKSKDESVRKKDDWDNVLQRRYGYEYDYWHEYKPWI